MSGAERVGRGSVHRTHTEVHVSAAESIGVRSRNESRGPAKGQTLKGSYVKAPVWSFSFAEKKVWTYGDQREGTIGDQVRGDGGWD